MYSTGDNTTSVDVDVHGWMRKLTGTVCALSMFGCIIIIVSYALWPSLRSKSRFLLACLSVGDYMNATGLGVSSISPLDAYDSDTVSCKLQAVLTTLGPLLSFFWTSCIAIYLYITIVRGNGELADKLIIVFNLVSVLVPAVVTGVALGKGKLGYTKYGDTAGWCWISGNISSSDTHLWMVLTGKGWEILSYVVVVVLYVLIKVHIWREVG